MKKITLSALIIMTSIISLQAQLYTPTGTILGNSLNSNIGIGTNAPLEKLSISGDHGDTRFLLHSTGGGTDVRQADLMLWASEPGLTYNGVGIGNNIHNFKNNLGGISLLNPARGGSYIRLLDNSMLFNVVSSSGTDRQAFSIDSNGTIAIGRQEAPGNTVGEIIRLSILPYGHTGGPWTIKSRDIHGYAFMDINYGSTGSTLTIKSNQNVGIGTKDPAYKLDVCGTIRSNEVKVDLLASCVPDYVFADDYKLKSLQEVEEFIKQNSHLPEIPSAKEIEKNGLMLAEMNMSLLKKIEEMTLYMIEMKKEIEILKQNK
ncbi:hypothetical protein LNQ49_18610 [Flavobacterium sp. F-65]|uniref:Chaperone of endosialidase n=1 Tax=Flavobacterium pisciphilum TaxID=2893755 RepID=A0ABS8MXT6_9FLAO|nr:hypothetical protein [Flavobacterium sp. F-65]MCC9073594.1 hypothetical protein [Flavobacterium sp. F-65]